MAETKNSRTSEGVCKKICNALSSLRATTHRLSHQHRGSISITSDKETLPHTTGNPAMISSPQTKQVHALHQPGLSKMIPFEFEPPAANFPSRGNKTLPNLYPVAHSSRKGISTGNPAMISSPQTKQVHVLHQPGLSKTIPIEFEPPAAKFPSLGNKTLPTLSPVAHSSREGTSTGKPGQDFAEKEILIVQGQNLARSPSRKMKIAQPEKATTVTAHGQANKVAATESEPPNHVPFAKAKSKMGNDLFNNEAKFSDYIAKVKDRMVKTALNVDGDEGNSPISGSSDE